MPLPCTNYFLAISYKKRFNRLYKMWRMATLAYILLRYHHKKKKADVTGRGQDTKHHKYVMTKLLEEDSRGNHTIMPLPSIMVWDDH